MSSYLKFVAIAEAVASASKDTSTKVGAVILGPDHEIRSTGWNGLPRGVAEANPERHIKPEKYYWYAHAEENAVAQAARMGVSLRGCTILVTSLAPCTVCARLIIQSGITKVVVPKAAVGPTVGDRWREEARRSFEMFKEAQITVDFI